MDYQVGGIFRALTAVWAVVPAPEVTVCFATPAPDDPGEYIGTFAPVPVSFGQTYFGFKFPARYLDVPLRTADSHLHDVIRQYAEAVLAEIHPLQHASARVRAEIIKALSDGNATVVSVAKQLHMSERTMARRLDEEGTTFRELLDEIRHRLALRHVAAQALELNEIAFLLGFSQVTAFHRAFKRWTGKTPLEYRRSHRGTQVTLTVSTSRGS
jgi:AraC-like DNA-binding protein